MGTVRRSGAAVLVVALLLLATACQSDDRSDEADSARPQGTITVAAFGFSESRILGEIYARALEREGFRVTRPLGLVSGELIGPALEQGVVDVVPRYLGSALAGLEPDRVLAGVSQIDAYARLRRAYARRGVTVATPAPGENKNGLVVTRATARRLDLRSISDLTPVASNLVLGGPPECEERPLCLPGLRRVYGLNFREFRPLDAGGPLTVGALEGDEVDVGVLFTSDGHLGGSEFVLLADDRNLQPPENVVPVVRSAVVRRFGRRVVRVLDEVSADLNTAELVALNRRVDIEGVSSERAAADWLRRH